ncbi:hypothetical protein BaRGS_00005083 [Batillaria attramentaria]|uniref:Uncharacterized protein n=1 Tax=Batillaria attramentaria TaxID=370345 RepID=A0ABD0LWX0_9CAEN
MSVSQGRITGPQQTILCVVCSRRRKGRKNPRALFRESTRAPTRGHARARPHRSRRHADRCETGRNCLLLLGFSSRQLLTPSLVDVFRSSAQLVIKQ